MKRETIKASDMQRETNTTLHIQGEFCEVKAVSNAVLTDR
jgi:hypothetical protein